MTKQILYVDDDISLMNLVKIILRRRGYAVEIAPNGFAALSLLESSIPDLLILDVMMPGMDGIVLCKQVRNHPQTARIPIIVLSVRSDPKTKHSALEAGADIFLPKLSLHSELLPRVQAILGIGGSILA
jgi:DNA-binding response OmpR family regulator